MSTGETVTVETANISAGGDPVLHLLDFDGTKFAVDDNAAGGTAAKVTYVADEPKTVIVMTRSKDQGTAGTADLLKNGQPWKSGVTFAGWFGTYDGLVAGENLHTVQIPNGSTGSHRIYILEPDGLGLARSALPAVVRVVQRRFIFRPISGSARSSSACRRWRMQDRRSCCAMTS